MRKAQKLIALGHRSWRPMTIDVPVGGTLLWPLIANGWAFLDSKMLGV